MSLRIEIGAAAEESAARYLRAKGYAIVERNFRVKAGELDIIAKDGETIVFVEVRRRSRSDFGTAAESIGFQKRRRLIKAALLYSQKRNLDCPMRFDVVAIDGTQMSHIENAFTAD